MNITKQFISELVKPTITILSVDPKDYMEVYKELWLENELYHEKVSNFPFGVVPQESDFYKKLESIKKYTYKEVLFLAKVDDTFVGMTVGWINKYNKSYGIVCDVYIKEQYRGLGLGRDLVVNCISWLKSMGCETITLGVLGGNEKVLTFYKKLGFELQSYELWFKGSKPTSRVDRRY